jgi:hypothetical protein
MHLQEPAPVAAILLTAVIGALAGIAATRRTERPVWARAGA